ncbi:MAG: YihY/virulence factor BrkB family protein [bacterium]|nr:YihY/virulence factor BrkB family protein [bacterium]
MIVPVLSLFRETFESWNANRAPRLAAALAYYAMFSIAPILVILVAIAGAVYGENAVRGELSLALEQIVGRESAQFVQEIVVSIQTAPSGRLATVISVIVVVFGAMNFFAALQDALNTIWGVSPHLRDAREGILFFLKSRLLSFLMVVIVGALLLLFIAFSSIVNAVITLGSGLGVLPDFAPGVLRVLDLLLSTTVITLMFAILFKVLPDAHIAAEDVFFGALVTALLFVVGETLLSLYLGSGAVASVFGAAGTLVVLLVWVYYSAQILLLGAEFTRVFAKRRGVHIRPRSPRPEDFVAPPAAHVEKSAE